MMSQVALYARVSSDRQADTNTIGSQIAVLQERIKSDGEELSVLGVFALKASF